MRKEWIKRSGITAAAGGLALSLSSIYLPRNDAGADLSMQAVRLHIEMDAARSNDEIVALEGEVYLIKQNPDYQEFDEQRKKHTVLFAAGAAMGIAGTAAAFIDSGEANSSRRNSQTPRLRRRRT